MQLNKQSPSKEPRHQAPGTLKKPLAVIYGHFSDITALKLSTELAIIASADENCICYIHRLNGRFLRMINLQPMLQSQPNSFIKYIRIHVEGYILFLTDKNYLIMVSVNFFENYTNLKELRLSKAMSKRISNDTQKQYQAVHEQYYNSILLNVQLEQQAQIRNIDFFEDKHIVYTVDTGDVFIIREFYRYFQPSNFEMDKSLGRSDEHNQDFLRNKEKLYSVKN